MQNTISLLISGNTSGGTAVGGEMDLYPGEEINLVLSVKDVRDITSTSASYSQTFQIPGTKNNNQILGNLFLIGADGNFDPRKKADCSLYVDSLQIIDGTMQVVGIDVDDRDKPVYSINVFGPTKDFNNKIKNKYLTDYDWSELNHILNVTGITNTWSGTSSLGYYYSIKDYGYDYTLKSVQGTNAVPGIPINNWYPDIYNKYIIDKIFSAEGFTYASQLLSSTTITETIIPYSNDPQTIMGSDYVSGKTFTATKTPTANITISAMSVAPYNPSANFGYDYKRRIIQANVFSGGTQASGGGYVLNPSGDSYVFDTFCTSSFSVYINYQYTQLTDEVVAWVGARFFRSTYSDEQPFFEDSIQVPNSTIGSAVFTSPIANNPNGTLTNEGLRFRPFLPGERVWVEVYFYSSYDTDPSGASVPWKIAAGGLTWKHYPSAERTFGSSVNMNNVIPEKVLVTDYLKSIFNMFNIYMEPSKTVRNKFTIESFEDYFANGVTYNWSTKLDRSQKITQTLLTEELAKKYLFTYKDDTDFLNTEYKRATKRTYGDWWYDVENDFTTEEKKIEVMFSPTPVDNINGSTDFIIPKMGQYDANGRFGQTKFNPRFLRKNPSNRALPTGEYWRITGTTLYTTYPYAGHLNDPYNGTIDYNWGSVPKVYYPWSVSLNGLITENNLVNGYWKKYLDEVTDKEAKMIKCYVKLTPTDIANFNFCDKVYIEGLTSEGGHTYRVNSITYPTSGKPALVELIKVLTKYTNRFPSRKVMPVGVGVGIWDKGFTLGSAKSSKPRGIAIGDYSYLNSDVCFSIGHSNIINGASEGTSVFGSRNYINHINSGTTVFGSDNLVYIDAGASTIIGDSNTINSGSTNVYIKGNRNSSVYVNKGNIIGNDNAVNVNGDETITHIININGDGNYTFGSATGITINGANNYVYNDAINVEIKGESNATQVGVRKITLVGDSNVVVGNNTGFTIHGDSNTINDTALNGQIVGHSNVFLGNIDHLFTNVIGSGNTLSSPGSNVHGIANLVTNGTNVSLNGHRNRVINSTGTTVHGYDNIVYSGTSGFIMGSGNTVSYSDLPTIQGHNNTVHSAATNVTIFGSGNIVHSGASEVIIYGNNNTVHTGATRTKIYGDTNIVLSGAYNSNIIGNSNTINPDVVSVTINNIDNITATASDTVHSQNHMVYDVFTLKSTSNTRQAGGSTNGLVANAFGSGATANNDYATAFGLGTIASGYSSFAIGVRTQANGYASFACGEDSQANSAQTFATGVASVASRYGEFARSSAGNYGQFGSVMAMGITASAGTANLYLEPLTNSKFSIEAGTSYYFKIKAAAADYAIVSSGYSASFEGTCLLKNVGGTVTAVGVPTVTQVYSDTLLNTSSIALAADNTNKGLSIVANSGTGPGMIWTVEVQYVKVKHNPL